MYDSATAAKLSVLYDTLIVATDVGYRIKETPTHYIIVQRMLFNWRISTQPKDGDWSTSRHFCYYGGDMVALLHAVSAAHAWDGSDDTRPEGYDKDVNREEYRNPGTGQKGIS